MLQYILTASERYSVAELAQMAVEGGCLWISLHLPELTDEDIKALVAPDVVDMCREASVFLTVDDRPALARELGLHGVRLSRRYFLDHPGESAMSLREELGPEAVIGIETADPSTLPAMVPADIDFVTLPRDFDRDARERFVTAARAAGSELPIVAEGDFDPAAAATVVAEGCAGVAVGRSITNAADPVEAMQLMLIALGVN